MPALETLSNHWNTIQRELFPCLEKELDAPLSERHKLFITVLDFAQIENFVRHWHGLPGRPQKDRQALARAFAAKPVFKIGQTKMLIERLQVDKSLRRLCGWTFAFQIPSEATFSRSFGEFAQSSLPVKMHAALVKATHKDRLVGHVSRDSTAIKAREKPVVKAKVEKPKGKPGRPKKGEERPQKKRRLDRQQDMTLNEMLADLPTKCNVGSKRNSKGYKQSWTGYKLHMDIADGGIPVSCVLTSASLHDSQVAIPLAEMTARRTNNCYDLMDAAYDAPEIKQHSLSLGHVPIIDINPRSNKQLKRELSNEKRRLKRVGHKLAEDVRYNERSTAERSNGRLKDEFGARHIWVRGNEKVMCHLMFGVLALTVDQLLKFVA